MVADEDITEIIIEDACFNLQTQNWQFDIVSPIEFVSIWGYCERPDEYTFINSIDEVPDWYLCGTQPGPGMSTDFITDLLARFEGYLPGLLYYPEELIREEEMFHFSQFVQIINEPEW